jgi:branched-chain amino acid transport system permease protein
VLSARYGWSPLPELAVALPAVALVAFLVGIPTLRLSGHYLAMATLGFGIIVFILFQELDFLTGGPSGLTGISSMSLFGVKLDSDRSFYYLTAAALLLCLLLSLNLVRSRVGRALRAIHGSEVAASALGVDTARFKVGVFVLSAVYAALAGWLYAHYVTFISPGSFGFGFSVKLVTMVVIGSLGSLWGAIFGAALLTALPEFLTVFADYDILVFGALLMLVMIFMPRGFLRGVEDGAIRLWRRWKRGKEGMRQ